MNETRPELDHAPLAPRATVTVAPKKPALHE